MLPIIFSLVCPFFNEILSKYCPTVEFTDGKLNINGLIISALILSILIIIGKMFL